MTSTLVIPPFTFFFFALLFPRATQPNTPTILGRTPPQLCHFDFVRQANEYHHAEPTSVKIRSIDDQFFEAAFSSSLIVFVAINECGAWHNFGRANLAPLNQQ
jgi:hypothetical protein